MILRVTAVYPHGTAFRYDLEYIGLEPGSFDLKSSLIRRDGSSNAEVPSIPVEIKSLLPPGQVPPHRLDVGEPPSVGGYRTTLIVLGVLWAAGLFAIIFMGRKARIAAKQGERPMTLEERLRPLVEQSIAGTLSRPDRARLELALVALWRRRLGLESQSPDESLRTLRAHPDAGPLLVGLEDWLHRPSPPKDVDVAALLRPYRDLPADALDPSSKTD
jgi:hypothetical protein